MCTPIVPFHSPFDNYIPYSSPAIRDTHCVMPLTNTRSDWISNAYFGLWINLWNMWPTERKPGTSCKYWIRVRGNFIRTGRFLAKVRLLHQHVTRGLHCIILNYEARLCYYKDAISLNSHAGQWNTGACCYGQLKHAFSKKAISQASSLYTVVFLFIETM